MENKKRKFNEYNNCKHLQNSVSILSECTYEKPESKQQLEKNRLSENNESCDFKNDESSSDNANDDDSKSDVLVDNHCKEIHELQEWIVSKNIPHEHANDLLRILRQRLLPNLPKTTKTLLKCSAQFNIENKEISDGSNQSTETVQLENSDIDPFLQVNVNSLNSIDGVSNVENVYNPLDIPIIEIQNDKCKSEIDFQSKISLQLSEINKNITLLRQRQEDMMNFLIDKKVIPMDSTIMFTDFFKRYQYKLPLESMENFLQFDEQLKTDQFLLNDVCLELRRLVDKDYSISKSYVQMLKKFLSKDLALQFTAVRKSRSDNKESKKLFKPTEFCKCMDAALTCKRSETALLTTNSMLVTGLSDVLCNVKNWNKFK